MGIGIVLILYAIVLTVAACFAAAILAAVTFALTKRSARKRKRMILTSVLFPFACLVFAGAWFGAYWVINYEVFQRDPGLGDTWQTPLPNGYALLMIDTTDQGTVYNPRTQLIEGAVSSRDDAVFGVRQLQVSKDLILGARDSGYFERLGGDSNAVDTYFELNTTERTRVEFKSLDQLRQIASNQGITLNLRPFVTVFGEYRTTWFDFVFGALFLLIPAAGFLWLGVWIWKNRVSDT